MKKARQQNSVGCSSVGLSTAPVSQRAGSIPARGPMESHFSLIQDGKKAATHQLFPRLTESQSCVIPRTFVKMWRANKLKYLFTLQVTAHKDTGCLGKMQQFTILIFGRQFISSRQ